MLVVDKDAGRFGEWTLGEVKTEWLRRLAVLLFRENRDRCRSWCGLLGHLYLLASLNACDNYPLCILQLHLCPSELPLHLGVRVSLNVSTSRLSLR